MNRHHRIEKANVDRRMGFFAGFLAGSLAGAGVMLLLAPRTGKKTRSELQRQGARLQHQAAERVEDMATDVSGKAHQFADDVQKGAGKLQQHAQEMISEGGK